ncbi:MAG: TlpA family protein disulfide reductase [Planctomycetota bacterium]|jgi:hypothetical protein
MHEARAEKGMVLLGVTKEYQNRGLLPSDKDQLKQRYREGEKYTGTTIEEYMQHLKDFREVCEINYPFVVGTSDDFKNYGVSGIPTMYVLDKQGVVRFVAVGGAKEGAIAKVVDRLLAEE